MCKNPTNLFLIEMDINNFTTTKNIYSQSFYSKVFSKDKHDKFFCDLHDLVKSIELHNDL